jgi:hypothetical protein
LGEDWTQIKISEIRRNIGDYLKCSWNTVLNLKENNDSMAPNVATESMMLLHIHFSKICKTEATRFVVDEWLKETMRRSLKNMLLPICNIHWKIQGCSW